MDTMGEPEAPVLEAINQLRSDMTKMWGEVTSLHNIALVSNGKRCLRDRISDIEVKMRDPKGVNLSWIQVTKSMCIRSPLAMAAACAVICWSPMGQSLLGKIVEKFGG